MVAPFDFPGCSAAMALLLIACGGGAANGAHTSEPEAGTSTTSSSSGASSSSGGTSSSSSSGSGSSGTSDAGHLDPTAPPGTNFDLSLWELQEPVGTSGSVTTISRAMLVAGYQDSYFYTDPTDGAMTFWDPENGLKLPNSNYPRSELREVDSNGALASWPVMGTNTLSATLEVVNVPDHVVVGQVHIGSAIQAGLAASTLPLLELFYHANGSITVGIESSPTGTETVTALGNVPLGTKFSYIIALTGDGTGNATIAITIDGSQMTFPMPSGFVGYGEYFKAGDYDQIAGTDAGVGATVKFYGLSVTHG